MQLLSPDIQKPVEKPRQSAEEALLATIELPNAVGIDPELAENDPWRIERLPTLPTSVVLEIYLNQRGELTRFARREMTFEELSEESRFVLDALKPYTAAHEALGILNCYRQEQERDGIPEMKAPGERFSDVNKTSQDVIRKVAEIDRMLTTCPSKFTWARIANSVLILSAAAAGTAGVMAIMGVDFAVASRFGAGVMAFGVTVSIGRFLPSAREVESKRQRFVDDFKELLLTTGGGRRFSDFRSFLEPE